MIPENYKIPGTGSRITARQPQNRPQSSIELMPKPLDETLHNMHGRLDTLVNTMEPEKWNKIQRLFECLCMSIDISKNINNQLLISNLLDDCSLEQCCTDSGMKCLIPIILKKLPDMFETGMIFSGHFLKSEYRDKLNKACSFSMFEENVKFKKLTHLVKYVTYDIKSEKEFFIDAEFHKINIYSGSFDEHNLSNSRYNQVVFHGDLEKAIFQNATFENVLYRHSRNRLLHLCNFTDASFKKAKFIGCHTIFRCDFTNTIWEDTTLIGKFINCDMINLKLLNVTISCCNTSFSRSNFKDTDLTKLQYSQDPTSSLQIDNIPFLGANLTGAILNEEFFNNFIYRSTQGTGECAITTNNIEKCIFTINSIGLEYSEFKIRLCNTLISYVGENQEFVDKFENAKSESLKNIIFKKYLIFSGNLQENLANQQGTGLIIDIINKIFVNLYNLYDERLQIDNNEN